MAHRGRSCLVHECGCSSTGFRVWGGKPNTHINHTLLQQLKLKNKFTCLQKVYRWTKLYDNNQMHNKECYISYKSILGQLKIHILNESLTNWSQVRGQTKYGSQRPHERQRCKTRDPAWRKPGAHVWSQAQRGL